MAIFYICIDLLYNIQFWGLSWTPLPTLISDVINGRSLLQKTNEIALASKSGWIKKIKAFYSVK